MKKLFIITLIAMVLIGCDSSAPPVSEKPISDDTIKADSRQETETQIAHTVDGQAKTLPTVEASVEKKKWTRGGSPIDTSKFDADVSKAEKNLKSKPTDETLRKAASGAYYRRGVALTKVRQYASAIGDYRRALKYDSQNADAKRWIATIIGIYESIDREAPKEGEEPPPLEFKKDKA